MKSIFTIFAAVLFTISIYAQVPEKISYQAIIRNAENQLVTNHEVGIQISIIQGTIEGTVVYIETHTPTTNANGLLTIEIGDGSIVSGDFSAINWSDGPYFIKSETDPAGGTNYTISGTSQLLSVPYALHAKAADTITGPISENDPQFESSAAGNITEEDITSWNNKQDKLISGTGVRIAGNQVSLSKSFYLGQDTLGGIVFYVYTGGDGQQHGLIVSKTQSEAKWQNTASNTGAWLTFDGAINTALMNNSPAKDWVRSNFTDEWYLPGIDELNILFNNRVHVNKTLIQKINEPGVFLLYNSGAYWSSSELSANTAFMLICDLGSIQEQSKLSDFYVRAIRAF